MFDCKSDNPKKFIQFEQSQDKAFIKSNQQQNQMFMKIIPHNFYAILYRLFTYMKRRVCIEYGYRKLLMVMFS